MTLSEGFSLNFRKRFNSSIQPPIPFPSLPYPSMEIIQLLRRILEKLNDIDRRLTRIECILSEKGVDSI